jgi:hypothetical protein
MKASDRSKAEQPGIPTDSTDNQLKDWIYNARLANIENDKELQAIKGDERRISSHSTSDGYVTRSKNQL